MICVVKGERWERVTLEMNPQGVADFRTLTQSASHQPAVYVHIEAPTRRVLRVGKAEGGLHRRWTTARNGHLATFEWAMGWSERYQPYAPKFPKYVLFFWRLAGMRTNLWFLTCEKPSVDDKEEDLIAEYGPIWEEFRRVCKAKGVRKGERLGRAVSGRDFTDPALPNLDGLQSRRLWPPCDKGE